MEGLHLPDLVINSIIQILPTKAAVRMSFLSKQWQDLWLSRSILEFDENRGEDREQLQQKQQHNKFINFLKRYLKLGVKQEPVDKLSIRMMDYSFGGDAAVVDKLLSSSFQRNIKELDMSLQRDRYRGRKRYFYCLSCTTFVDAKSISRLNLEYVRIKLDTSDESLLPSLKTMSLKDVHFDPHALLILIQQCPLLESLSLASCSFDYEEDTNGEFRAVRIPSSSLKLLQVKHCKGYSFLVNKAINLESFTFVSSGFSLVNRVVLCDSNNLKYINIHSHGLKQLSFRSDHESLEATIVTPSLSHLYFFGYVRSKISLEAPKLIRATILLLDFYEDQQLHILEVANLKTLIVNSWIGRDGPESSTIRPTSTAFDGPWKHLPILADFLRKLCSSQYLHLHIGDFRNLIFPKEFRNTCSSSPLMPDLKYITIATQTSWSRTRTKEEDSDFLNSLRWVAPSHTNLCIQDCSENNEYMIVY